MKIAFTIIGIALVAIILLQAFKSGGGKANDEELLKQINEGALLVDVRTVEEFEAGHVKGSVNIPLDQIEKKLDKFKDQKHIIVFCRSGRRSGKAKEILEKNGFKNVINGGSWANVNKLVS